MMTETEKAAQTALIAEARAAGLAEGKTAAATEATTAAQAATKAATEAERKRVHAIQTCDAAKGKPALAAHLALETDMTVEAAQALLAKAAVETPDKPANQLAGAMAHVPNPKVGADGQPIDTGTDQPRPVKTSAEVIALRNKQAGLAR